MASRSLDTLTPDTRNKMTEWLARCRARGVEMLVYCTFRSSEEQATLYALGRTAPGKKVTNAKPGWSWHQYGRAVDAVPLVHGKPLWKYDPERLEWRVFQHEAADVGLEWAGAWHKFREYVHLQNKKGRLADLVGAGMHYNEITHETTPTPPVVSTYRLLYGAPPVPLFSRGN